MMADRNSKRPFQIRTLTAGINLDRRRYKAQIKKAFEFLKTGKNILETRGFQVQTLRITTNSFPDYIRGLSSVEAFDLLQDLSDLIERKDVFLSVGSGISAPDYRKEDLDLLISVMSETRVFSNIVISDPKKGIFPQTCQAAAVLIKELSKRKMMSNFHFAAIAGLPPQTPFFPAAYHQRKRDSFGIGTEAAQLVMEKIKNSSSIAAIQADLSKALESEFKAIEETSLLIARKTGRLYEGIDTSPAPMGDNSIGQAVEDMIGSPFGSSGTLYACAFLTGMIKSIPVKQAGYCGLMLPVMEDSVLARRAAEGRYGLNDLLSYSAVCGTGLDVIPLPGDIRIEEIKAMLLDIAALSWKLKKPLSARLIPVPGKKAGENVKLDSPYLVPTRVFSIP